MPSKLSSRKGPAANCSLPSPRASSARSVSRVILDVLLTSTMCFGSDALTSCTSVRPGYDRRFNGDFSASRRRLATTFASADRPLCRRTLSASVNVQTWLSDERLQEETKRGRTRPSGEMIPSVSDRRVSAAIVEPVLDPAGREKPIRRMLRWRASYRNEKEARKTATAR